jgi:hypothetical protein
MVVQPDYPWYFDPLSIFCTLSMLFLPAYLWYIEHPTYAILTHLSMVCCSPLDYKWGASTYHRSSIYHTVGRFSIRGLNIPWMQIYPGIKIPWESKYNMSARTLWKSIQFLFISISSFPKSNVSIFVWVTLWFLERNFFCLGVMDIPLYTELNLQKENHIAI